MSRIRRFDGTDLWSVPRRLYCGPTAACVLTGLDYEDAVRPALNAAKGAKRANQGVMGLSYKALLRALSELGWTCEPMERNPGRSYTLRQWLEWAEGQTDWPLLIHVTGHYVVAQHGLVVDNREVKPIGEHWVRRRYVRHAWRVSQTVDNAFLSEGAEP